MIGTYRFDMRGTLRIDAGENLYGGCTYLAADVQLENTLFAPRGRAVSRLKLVFVRANTWQEAVARK